MSDTRDPLLVRALPAAVVAVIIAVALVPLVLEASGAADRAASLGGDFPSFYGAGRIVIDGHIDELYDPKLQEDYQAGYHEPGELLFFAYPPFVAVAYALIAWMPYGAAFSIHALMAIGALAVAAWLATRELTPAVSTGRAVVVATAGGLVAYPVLRAVLGGQNTTFTLVLLVGIWWGIEADRRIVAGLCLAGLAFKPQFALVVVVLLIAARRWKELVAGGAGIGVLYLATAAVAGPDWPYAWLDQVREFGEMNDIANGGLMVNIVGWSAAALASDVVSTIVAWVLLVVVGVVALWTSATIGIRWASIVVLATATLLLSPSTLYYDGGIAIVVFALVAAAIDHRAVWAILVIAASWVQLAEPLFGWSPLFLVLVAIFVSSAVIARGNSRDSLPRVRRA